ncbi:hypothetical protein BC830DRAFT_1153638 [Chytriomyces sp. MP71]|nr:hypothetical protein BC830DRAFT_1153638 [Chytriomyces sp. MP71]
MERSKNENDETRRKILDGFRKIKELDSVLKEKTLLAQSFSKPSTSAATLTNGTTSPTPLHPFPGTPATAPHPDFVDDDESECAAGASEASFELRSVRSLDTRTFLTEPRLLARRHGLAGVRGGSGGTGRGGTREAAEGIRPGMPTGAEGVAEKKGYKLGDFIQRNIVLGPQARYYHAMTEVEQERVDRILKEVDEEDEDEDDGMEEGESASSRRVADTPDEISSSVSLFDALLVI